MAAQAEDRTIGMDAASAALPAAAAAASAAAPVRKVETHGVLVKKELPGWAQASLILLSLYAAATALPILLDCISGEEKSRERHTGGGRLARQRMCRHGGVFIMRVMEEAHAPAWPALMQASSLAPSSQ